MKHRDVARKIPKGLGLCLVPVIKEQFRHFSWVIAGTDRKIRFPPEPALSDLHRDCTLMWIWL